MHAAISAGYPAGGEDRAIGSVAREDRFDVGVCPAEGTGIVLPNSEREAAAYAKLEGTLQLMCPGLSFEGHDLIPSQIRGVLIWRNCGLKPEERALIASQLRGDWTHTRVSRELCRLVEADCPFRFPRGAGFSKPKA